MRAFFLIVFLMTSQVQAASWPAALSTLFAKDGATCELRITTAEATKPLWEGRILARRSRVRVINRRTTGAIPPGPEELLWTGSGLVKFTGPRPSEFSPGPRLTLAEVYLLSELLVPLWTPGDSEGSALQVEGVLGSGYLTLLQDGRPESLVVRELSRPLWDGSSSLRIAFEHTGEKSPWQIARLAGSGGATIALERLRFRRDALSDDVFAVENEGGLKLADLSKPLGALVGSDTGGYAETAGASAAFKSSKVVSSGGSGSLYLGPVPTEDEVDRFLREGRLGRYGDEE